MTATDGDGSDNTISYSIIHGNAGAVFKINASTGWIETAKILDGNNVDQYILTIRAEDSKTLLCFPSIRIWLYPGR